jgi:type I restriction enzyme S subunit
MREDWIFAILTKDLDYIKTGVSNYLGKKEYYSTGSIKNDRYTSEGMYSFTDRPSRANRCGQLGDVLQARMKDTDKAILIDEKFDQQLFSTGFIQIRPNPETLLSKYIYHYLKSILFLNSKDEICSGSTQSALNDENAQKILIPIAPIPIQRAIVAKIEELFSDLDKGIADLNLAKDQLVIFRQAVLKKAFEGELTKEWREKQTNLPTADELLEQIKEERERFYNQQLEDWKKAVKEWEKNGKKGKKPGKPTAMSLDCNLTKSDQELKATPSNWSYITLDFATYKLGDGLHGTPQYDENGEYWFINGNNLDDGKILLKPETKKVNKVEYDKYKKELNNDTILVSINGTIGNVSFYNDEKVILGKSACYFNLLSSFDKNYIRWLIDSFGFIQYAERNATGSTIKNVPLSAMRNFVFPLCSIQEQLQIVKEIESRLSVCDKVEQSISDSLEKAKALRQSILKKAFEGKLLSAAEIERCKQEEDYEPASVLLEKIKKEKKK